MPYSPQRLPSQLALLLSAFVTSTVFAQQPPPAAPPPAAAAPAAAAPAPAASQSLSSSLGLFVFPAKNQDATQQSGDEAACYGWAKSQTGIDPMNITAPQPDSQASQEQAANTGGGERVRGAARGAAAGAAIGAIAGDAGQGAAVGAAAGTMAGGAAKRRGKQQAAAQQQQEQAAAAQQQQAAIAQQKATYNKAFSACIEGKGYTVK
jgi:YmgG-like glycine-zipper protein